MNKNCQLGWEAETTCSAWGAPSPFHGCRLSDGHGDVCACLCGAERLMYRDRRKNRERRDVA